jgi:two-component system response regulator DesR
MIRIMIAEDVRILRETLAAVLDLEDDLEVVAQVERGDQIIAAAVAHRPDVALLDINLPGADGLTGAGQIRRQLPSCKVVMLSGHARPGYLRRALASGASGFLLKHAPTHELIDVIRRVRAGERIVDPQLAIIALEKTESPLAEREAEVLKAAATGAEAHEIAELLSLSRGTVRNYLSSAVMRLGARNRIDAIRIATDEGWI